MRKLRRTRSKRRLGRRAFGYNKYGAKRTTINGITFASKAEARRYVALKLLEKAGTIKALQLQVKFELHVNDVKIGSYIADFVYYIRDRDDWYRVVEDVKGFKTPLYRWKKKHVAAEHGFDIAEV